MIYVINVIEARPDRRDDLLAEFRRFKPSVLAEAGCIGFVPTVDLPDGFGSQPAARDDVITLIQVWESLEHVNAHLAAPLAQEFRDIVKDMIARSTPAVLEPV